MSKEPQLEPLPQYTLPALLVESLFNYLGTQPAAQVEFLRAGIYREMLLQQQAAALAKKCGGAPR